MIVDQQLVIQVSPWLLSYLARCVCIAIQIRRRQFISLLSHAAAVFCTQALSLSMHRCLEVAEILATIIDYVKVLPHIAPFDGGYTPFTEGNHHLLQLAVTCRAFSEPALNALWRTQKSLLPLIETLPEDAWDTTVTHEDNDKFVHRVVRIP